MKLCTNCQQAVMDADEICPECGSTDFINFTFYDNWVINQDNKNEKE